VAPIDARCERFTIRVHDDDMRAGDLDVVAPQQVHDAARGAR